MADPAPDAASISWPEVCERRLTRQGLSVPLVGATPADVVTAMCGAHAQVMPAAELSVGLRLADGTRAAVSDALWTDRSLVKTYGPRGTVHLLPAVDLPIWHAALSAVPVPDFDRLLTADQAMAVAEAIGTALATAELTVDELGDQVIAATGLWAADPVMPAFGGMWPRWRKAIGYAAHRGLLCFGQARGRRVTYVNPRRWLPAYREFDEATSVHELITRYLRTYGPASPAHFARWLGAPPRWAADRFESMAGALEPVLLDGEVLWQLAEETWPAPAYPPPVDEGVRLLPYFDAYVVGSYPRELLFPGLAGRRALARGQAGNFPVLALDGCVAGLWHHRRSGTQVRITVEAFTRLTRSQRSALSSQAERVGQVLGAEPQLTLGPVRIGPHA
ncbi:MAG TPA: winged helix DNA-binding domain-containing protein [Streptosporangiaceae bacterium]|nr:winged helix DNA-binding domain-containing protein [Streptosporangiaceae bacterium]